MCCMTRTRCKCGARVLVLMQVKKDSACLRLVSTWSLRADASVTLKAVPSLQALSSPLCGVCSLAGSRALSVCIKPFILATCRYIPKDSAPWHSGFKAIIGILTRSKAKKKAIDDRRCQPQLWLRPARLRCPQARPRAAVTRRLPPPGAAPPAPARVWCSLTPPVHKLYVFMLTV